MHLERQTDRRTDQSKRAMMRNVALKVEIPSIIRMWW